MAMCKGICVAQWRAVEPLGWQCGMAAHKARGPLRCGMWGAGKECATIRKPVTPPPLTQLQGPSVSMSRCSGGLVVVIDKATREWAWRMALNKAPNKAAARTGTAPWAVVLHRNPVSKAV
jgi:hypothetical protein